MKGCSPDLARSIVDLLLNDPGTARCYVDHPTERVVITEETCPGCDQQFMPKAVGRQYCSRACYTDHLDRKRGGPLKPKTPKPMREDGSLGPGKRFKGEAAAYCKSLQGVATPSETQAALLEQFGITVGITTIYRCWRSHSHVPPRARPPIPISPAPPPARPPIPIKPKPKETIMPAVQTTEHARERHQLEQLIASSQRGTKAWICNKFDIHSPSLTQWMNNGTGVSAERLAPLLEWLEQVRHGAAAPPERENAPIPQDASREVRHLAERMRVIIARLNLSQLAAAEEAGTSQTAVSRAVRGLAIPEKDTAALLAWLESVQDKEGAEPLQALKAIAQTENLSAALGSAPRATEEPREPAPHTPTIVEIATKDVSIEEPGTEPTRFEPAGPADEKVAEAEEEPEEIAAAVAPMEPYPETRTLRQAVNGLGVLPASDDEPIGLTVPHGYLDDCSPPVGPPSPAEALSGFENLRREFAITGAGLERYDRRSPADIMLEAVARRGALSELERIGLELPEGARITISLEWGRS